MPEQPPLMIHAATSQPAGWRIAVLTLFGMVVLLGALQMVVPVWKSSGWPDAVLLLLTTMASIAAFAGRLPAPNVALAGGIAAGIGGLAHAVNAVAGLPFGRFEFRPEFGPQWFGVLPVAMLMLWAIASLTARGTARRLLQSTRLHPYHGWHVITLAVLLMATFHLALTPFAVAVKNWWTDNSMPLLGLASWTVLSLLIQIAITPLLLDKFPVSRPPTLSPLLVWVGMNLLMAAGLVSRHVQPVGALVLSAVQVVIFICGFWRR